jgi:hypothetical protein
LYGVEYVEILASHNATAPIDITGWSLQSAVTGVRAFIPRGSADFLMGTINVQEDIALSPGASAILSSGFSPVGTSFRENMCTGYLGSLQSFSPPLSENYCPSPRDMVPLTADNIRAYGDACLDYIRSQGGCQTPRFAPSNVSPACIAAAMNTLSYNGCAMLYRNTANFAGSMWRVFLSSPDELWRNTHDIIRLLDTQGRVVDVLTY